MSKKLHEWMLTNDWPSTTMDADFFKCYRKVYVRTNVQGMIATAFSKLKGASKEEACKDIIRIYLKKTGI